MRIPCPHCGLRSHEEFGYESDATRVRPEATAVDTEFHDYVYLRDNPDGAHRELWFHAAGCHAWLVVERNTRTHEILSVVAARERS